MKIVKTATNDQSVTLCIEGRVDTTTAPELEQAIRALPDTVTELILNLDKLVYISSAGLRVLLSAHKMMASRGGKLVITGANEVVTEIFEVTGFSDILNIE